MGHWFSRTLSAGRFVDAFQLLCLRPLLLAGRITCGQQRNVLATLRKYPWTSSRAPEKGHFNLLRRTTEKQQMPFEMETIRSGRRTNGNGLVSILSISGFGSRLLFGFPINSIVQHTASIGVGKLSRNYCIINLRRNKEKVFCRQHEYRATHPSNGLL